MLFPRRKTTLLCSLVIALLSLSGLFGYQEAWSQTPKANLLIAVPDKISDLNPFLTHSTFSANIADIIYDQLINLDATGQISGGLAKHVTVSEDKLTWTFELEEGLKFHDGKPLTAHDVVFSIETHRRISQNSIIKTYLDLIKIVTAPSDVKIIMQLNRPFQDLPKLLRLINIAPSHLFAYDGYPIDRNAYHSDPIGSGVYEIARITDDRVFLSPWNGHHEYSSRIPSVEILLTEGEQASLALFMRGAVDIVFNRNSSDFSVVDNMPRAKQFHYDSNILYALFLNLRREPFWSTELRKALNLAIDKNAMIKTLNLTAASPAGNIIDASKSNPEVSAHPYNQQLALKLFNKAGWIYDSANRELKKSDQSMLFEVLVAQDDSLSINVAQILQKNYESFGVILKIKAIPLPRLVELVFVKHEFESVIIPFTNLLGLFHHSVYWRGGSEGLFNFTGYNNPKVNQHLDEALYSVDDDTINAAQYGFQTEFHNDPPLVFLFWKQARILVKDNIIGLNPSPLLFFRKLHLARKVSNECLDRQPTFYENLLRFFNLQNDAGNSDCAEGGS